jgi:hypothetical protein
MTGCEKNVMAGKRDNIVTDRDEAVNGLLWAATP